MFARIKSFLNPEARSIDYSEKALAQRRIKEEVASRFGLVIFTATSCVLLLYFAFDPETSHAEVR